MVSDRKINNLGIQIKLCNFYYFLSHGRVFGVIGFQRWVYLAYLQSIKYSIIKMIQDL